jgi:hypothetical protein
MKRKVILILNLLLIISCIDAQNIMITNDSLRVHFQKGKPYEVYDYYQKRRFDDILDYKALYYDQELKDYLMEWLDINEYIDYKIDKYKKELYQRFEDRPDDKESFVKYYIEQSLKLQYDSIRSDTCLIKIYFTQAIEKSANERKIDLEKLNIDSSNLREELIPPLDVLFLHAKIAYPESYQIIKQWWYRQKKIISHYDGYMTDIFISLLMMNDPEAQFLFNKEIKKLFNSQWTDLFGIGINECLNYLSNAYAVRKLVEILSVTKSITTTSDETAEPYDKLTFDLLRYLMEVNKIENNPFQSLNDLNQMRKNKDKIIEAAERLIKKMEQEEKYWMSNMPFDYEPTSECSKVSDRKKT